MTSPIFHVTINGEDGAKSLLETLLGGATAGAEPTDPHHVRQRMLAALLAADGQGASPNGAIPTDPHIKQLIDELYQACGAATLDPRLREAVDQLHKAAALLP